MPRLRILCRDYPQRAVALATSDHALVFQHGSAHQFARPEPRPRCLVEFSNLSQVDLNGYRFSGYGYGTLGLINLDDDVFLCVVTGSTQAATVRPGETISRIDNVHFFCLNHPYYDEGLGYGSETQFAPDQLNRIFGLEGRELATDHPFLALKKLLSDGSFYYSIDFNLTDRLQNRFDKSRFFDIEALDEDMLWNSYMINPLLLFRAHLPPTEKLSLDSSQFLTCVIRGFSSTTRIPMSGPFWPQIQTLAPSMLTIISRQSSRRAGTRFNSRGIDDHGNVANFVETEVVLWMPSGIVFSYVQVRGSVPTFWEQTPGFLPAQQKIEVTRSTEAAQHAFDKHFDHLNSKYGAIHVVNLMSEDKPSEAELSVKFREHIAKNSLKQHGASGSHLQITEYDFHAESRGPLGYETSSQLKLELTPPTYEFAYFLGDGAGETTRESKNTSYRKTPVILLQKGVFRTNCLDCLDRTNLVQTILSSGALESFFHQQGERLSSEIERRHSTLWADNGDALSRIYAGTGAIKSSFTRHGKMSLAGALADARKSATRLYINNFSDNIRQNTIDILLGRLTNQVPVHLHDPLADSISQELERRASEYTFTKPTRIWTGTFNVNGRNRDLDIDLTPWLFPLLDGQSRSPIIFAVAFQEIVPLNPQQIMATDPTTRKAWENSVSSCLNSQARLNGSGRYVLLRSSQLVGAALMVYVKEEAINEIKNVEASTKKAGFQGIAGNKGGCAIRFEYSNTRICFVTAHLAAGFANYGERNRDYETMHRDLVFQGKRSIDDHDAIVWLGDFNYRINLGNERVRELACEKKYLELFEMDQLNHQMAAGLAFPSYSEGLITFPPTYKYDLGTNNYDTSEKARIPGWCDRVLWKGSALRQTNYNTADLRVSDHRPVWATFDCMVSVVNDARKSELRRLLYGEMEQKASAIPASELRHMSADDRTLAASSLSPPSSVGYRWWLDNGAPETSAMRNPAGGLFANPYRNSNPFLLTMEVDWAPVPNPANMEEDGTNAPPPIPLKPGTLRSTESPNSAQCPRVTGGMNTDIFQGHVGNHGGQDDHPAQGIIGSTNRTPRLSGPRPSKAPDMSHGALSSGYLEKTGNNTGDLLGSGMDEEVSWKPLLQ